MGLHRFLLEFEIDDVKYAGQRGERFLYRGSEGQLNAWIVHQDHGGRTILRAYKESAAGSMTLEDVLTIDLPIKIIGLESNGCLLSKTGRGLLRYSCQSSTITGIAETSNSRKAKQPFTDQDIQASCFPGMQESDSFLCGDLIISRHETIPKGFNGEPFLPESVLLVSPLFTGKKTEDVQPWIAIGNSQIDNNMNLIRCLDEQLFDIPIINFVIDYQPTDDAPLLIGWNRGALQAISIEQCLNAQQQLNIQANGIVKLENSLLEDASRSWINCQGRIAVWRDILSPGKFYSWKREN